MGSNFIFGGGASNSTMTPIVLCALLLAASLVVFLPKRYVLIPIVFITFLTPSGQELLIGGLHFYAVRVIVIAGLIRLAVTTLNASEPIFPGGFNKLDSVIVLYGILQGVTFLIREHAAAAFVYEIGFWMDTLGLYVIFRALIKDQSDLYRLIKAFSVLAGVLGLCMLYEYFTRVDLFSYLAGHTILPWMRDGRVRAQGPFAISITAGAFGATLFPLFIALFKCTSEKVWAGIGIAGATIIAFTSMSSTPITGYAAGLLALLLWNARRQMRMIRWGIAICVLLLALVMKAPIWFLIAHVNVAAGNAYDRAILINAAVSHFSQWWLLGTNNNSTWGLFTWDTCNQYVSDGVSGGLITLILLLAILTRGFSLIGRLRARAQHREEEWFFWAFGSALFVHLIVFMGVDYFDQMRNLWFIFLATLSAVTLSSAHFSARVSELSEKRIPISLFGYGLPSIGSYQKAYMQRRSQFFQPQLSQKQESTTKRLTLSESDRPRQRSWANSMQKAQSSQRPARFIRPW